MLHSSAACICCIRLFCTGVASRSASVTCRVGVPGHGLVDVMFSDVSCLVESGLNPGKGLLDLFILF